MKIQYKLLKQNPKYRVGTDGSIWSFRCKDVGKPRRRIRRWKRLAMSTTGRYITVMVNGKTLFVHALVLTAFKGDRPEGKEARHLDGNAHNNNLDNLEWSDHLTNMQDRERHNTLPFGEGCVNHKLTKENVVEIRRLRKTGLFTLSSLATLFKVSLPTVHFASVGVNWKQVA